MLHTVTKIIGKIILKCIQENSEPPDIDYINKHQIIAKQYPVFKFPLNTIFIDFTAFIALHVLWGNVQYCQQQVYVKRSMQGGDCEEISYYQSDI